MSDSTGPVRRRRIAGEAKAAVPAKKAVVKKAAAKKVPVAKPAPSAKKAPAAKKAPVSKTSAKKVPAGKASAKKVPAGKAPTKKPATAKASMPSTKAPAVALAPPADKKGPATKPTKKAAPAASSKVATAAAPPQSKVATVAKPVRSSTTSPVRPAAKRSKPSRRDLRWLVPTALVAVAALVVGVLLFVGVLDGKGGGNDGLVASNRQASSAAASASETIFSFEYDKLDEHLKASKALMTPAFAKEFDKIAPALTELAPQREIQVKAVARDSAALPCGDECSTTKANVLVFVDQARLVGGSKEPTVFANRISVSMVKEKDGWRVANIRAL